MINRSNKRKNSEIMLDAIGNISDRFIFEAEAYVPSKPVSLRRRFAIIAVSFTLILTLAVSALVGTLTRQDSEAEDSGSTDQTQNSERPTVPNYDFQEPPLTPPVQSLSSTLINMKADTEGLSSELERDMLFDGSARIIWRYEGEDAYRICTMSRSNAASVASSITTQKNFTRVDASAESDGLDGLWICFGDGMVYSPYLETAGGNVGYGALFDYERELEPSTEFVKLVESIISEKSN